MAVSLLVLRQFNSFSAWPEEALTALSEQLSLRRLTRRQLAFQNGESGECIAWVLEGSVWLMDHTNDDREVFMDRYTPGSLFGELHAFQQIQTETRGFVYVAATASSIAVARKQAIWSLFSNHPFTAQAMVMSMANRMGEFFRWRTILALPSAGERVAAVLLTLADPSSGSLPTGITQQEIAAYANTTRETVTRVMQRLQATNAVFRNGATWEITSPDKLREVMTDSG